MAVPSSDRSRRPFLLSLSLFLLLSALLVLLFIFLDPSPGTIAFLPSRLAGSDPSLPPPPLLPQQQNHIPTLTPGGPPRSQPAAPIDSAVAAAKAEENTDAPQPDATTGVQGSGSIDSPRADNNSGALDGKAGTSVAVVGDGSGGNDDEEEPVEVRWEMCRVGRGVAAADYIPCLDNVRAIKRLRSRRHMEHRERHCPVAPRPRCLVRLPAGYRTPVPWPRSRDMIWYNNVPHPKLVEYKKDQNWVTRSGDYLVFPGGGTQFKDGVGRYIQFIEQVENHCWSLTEC